jgi:hypothetical protein
VGTHGEALFVKCRATWFNLDGDTKLTLQDCELEDVIREPSNKFGGSTVATEKCKLRGSLRMGGGGTLINSLTVRDTVLEELDMHDAAVTGDVTMERVKAGFLKVSIKEGARNFVLTAGPHRKVNDCGKHHFPLGRLQPDAGRAKHRAEPGDGAGEARGFQHHVEIRAAWQVAAATWRAPMVALTTLAACDALPPLHRLHCSIGICPSMQVPDGPQQSGRAR